MVTLGPKQLMTVSTVLLAMSSAGLITGRVFLAYAHIGMDPVLHLCIAAKKWTSVGRPDRSW